MTFEPGTILGGKYRVDRVLGHGGMGVVVAATHVQLLQRVALKFLLPEFLHDPNLVERFVREARASAQLRGDHVCRAIDVGTLDNGAPYIVMELLEGRDLATVLAQHGPLAAADAAHFVTEACLGLAEAHALGMVHRDLKPGNLFLAQRPDGTATIKVLDFGIAKARGDTNFSITRTAAVMGSPGYMSPEQLRSARDVDVRSDIWSLGVILYELVTARAPFTAESITELALRVAMDPTPSIAAQLPRGFEAVVARCLEKDPARRFQDVASLATALAPFGRAHTKDLAVGAAHLLHGAPAGTPSNPHLGTAPTTLGGAASQAFPARARRTRWGLIGGAVAALAVGAVVAVAVANGGGGTDGATDNGTGSGAPAATAPDGSATSPSSTANAPSGSVNSPSGSVNSPSGAVNSPSGAVNSPSGAVNSPSGSVNSPSGSAAHGAGTAANGAGTAANGTGTAANGAVPETTVSRDAPPADAAEPPVDGPLPPSDAGGRPRPRPHGTGASSAATKPDFGDSRL